MYLSSEMKVFWGPLITLITRMLNRLDRKLGRWHEFEFGVEGLLGPTNHTNYTNAEESEGEAAQGEITIQRRVR